MEKVEEITIKIDGISVSAKKGEKILWAALDAGINIPNLCAVREAKIPFGSCRLCFVEIEGRTGPVTACTEPVKEGMVVRTDSDRISRLRRTAFELIMAYHQMECRNCINRGKCELLKIARDLGIKLKSLRFRKRQKVLPLDETNPFFIYDPNKCILCGKCVWVCHEKGEGKIDFAFRGIDTIITYKGDVLSEQKCALSGECIKICPAGAMIPRNFSLIKKVDTKNEM